LIRHNPGSESSALETVQFLITQGGEMAKPTQQDSSSGTGGARRRQDDAAPDKDREAAEAEALNDARALQQMIEGTPDSSDEFRRIEQKR
jgi:hypothetical protein